MTEAETCGRIAMPSLKSLDITIIANPGTGTDPVDWEIEIDPSHKNGDKIKLHHGNGYEIDFDLKDKTDLEVRFDASAPFFVKDGTTDPCPNTCNSPQIMVDSCKDDELVVIDWNYGEGPEVQDLRYQLNFVTKYGKRLNPFDPIIENAGGGTRPPTLF